MSKVIVIQMGSGSLHTGFPLVTAQLWTAADALPEQFTGRLAAAPELQNLNRNWQALYRALCDRPNIEPRAQHSSLDRDDEFEIEAGGVQNISADEFVDLSATLHQTFNQWLQSSEFGPIERPLRSVLSIADDIRIILTTQDATIRQLPWNQWSFLKDFPNAEIALSLPQYRRQSPTRTTRTKPRILAILGSSQGIDLRQEQQLLDRLTQATVTFLVQPARHELDQALWDKAGWDILFFAGHSSTEGQTGRLYINDAPEKNSLTIEALSEALSAALDHGLQLAIVNSCDGLGIANQLAHLNLPQVIVMREPVPNRVAQQFFQSFLDAYIQQTLPLYRAVKQARRQLQGLEDDFPGASWLPTLCQNPAETPRNWQDLCQPTSDRRPPSKPTSNRQDYRDRQILLNKVRNAWIKTVLQRSLPGEVAIEMGLIEQLDVVQTPALIALETATDQGQALPIGTQVIDYFEQLGVGRSLLILGAPGSGKTIALLNLAQILIDRAEQQASAPLPVVLNLSSWSGGKQSIQDWLIQELYRAYQVPQPTGSSWLTQGELLLLLDGLDEVQSHQRDRCVQAINAFRQDYGQVEMVLCSRWQDYQDLSQRLNLQAAVLLQPLTTQQIRHYCTSLGPDGEQLQQSLANDQQLLELATSPLMLNIMALAQAEIGAADSPDNDLPTVDLEERRRRLFNAYIDRMLSRRGSDTDYTPAAIITGLRQLAQQLQATSQSIFQIESIQPSWLNAHSHRWLYPLWLGISLGSIFSLPLTCVGIWLGGIGAGLSILLCWGVIGGGISGLIGGWLGGFTGGLIGSTLSAIGLWLIIPGLSIGLIAIPLVTIVMAFIFHACRDQIEPTEIFRWSWKRAIQWLVFGSFVGLIVSIPMLLAGNVEVRVLLPFTSLIFMLIGAFTKQSRMGNISTAPNQGIWQTGKNAVWIGSISTVIYGLLGWLILSWNTGGDRGSIQASLPFGAIAGVVLGTIMFLVGAEGSGVKLVQHFILRCLLWQQGQLPWNYAKFLDTCANRILLQKVGGNYIFIHRLLLEHFAKWRPSR